MKESFESEQGLIGKLTEIIHTNLENEDFGANVLAGQSGFNRKAMSRRLRRITGKSVSQFIRETRLQKSLELLREGVFTVSEIGYKVGFNSPIYFTRCFHNYFGFPPVKVKNGELSDPECMKLSGDNNKLKSAVKSRFRMVNASSGILIFILAFSIVGYFIYANFYHPDWTDDIVSSDGNIAIAVMPFQNLTKDTTWNIW